MRIPAIAKKTLKARLESRGRSASLLPAIASPLAIPPSAGDTGLSASPAAPPASVSAIASITFALVFLVAIGAFALGALPSEALTFGGNVEAGVVLLFVPLCALIFAVLVEVIRSALTQSFAPRTPRVDNAVLGWRPGHGEG